MFRKNSIDMQFYTYDNGIYTNEKPTLKPDHPEWTRHLKSTYKNFNPNKNYFHDATTAKNCPAIHNFFNDGIKFKMWMDLKIRVYPDGMVEDLTIQEDMRYKPVSQHDPRQYEHMYPSTKTAFKLNNPWIAKCKDDTKFILMESHYSTNFLRENNLYIAPGVIDYKYQAAVNIHVILDKKEEPYELYIPYGTPLITLFPLSNKKLNLTHNLVSKEQFDNIGNMYPKCPIRRYQQLIKNLNKSKS